MSFRFSRRVQIVPGLTLNFSKRGASISVGGRGAKMTLGTSGVRSTAGIPGTGLFFTKHSGWKSSRNSPRMRHSVFTSEAGQVIEASSKDEAIRQLALKDPSLGGTLGQRENDELVRELFSSGGKRMTLNTDEAKAMLAKVRADPRLKLTDSTGRKISISQFEAKIRRMELLDKVDENQKQIDKEQNEYEELLNMWRDLPPIPTQEEIKSALKTQSLSRISKSPPPPDFDKERQSLVESTQRDLWSKFPYSLFPGFLVKPKAKRMADGVWDSRRAEILSSYNEAYKNYEAESERAKAAWHEQENTRIGKLQRLVDGDLVEMHTTAVEIIESINFPFDTSCDIYLDDALSIFIHLDLPEIEDVIPTHKKKALKNGEISEVGISQSVRNRDYFELVIGQAILVAAHLFANLPTLKLVTIAGYTQRPRKKASDETDTYVFDIGFPKAFIDDFDTNVDDFRPLLRSLSPIMSLKPTWELEKIHRPRWLEDQNNERSETESTAED